MIYLFTNQVYASGFFDAIKKGANDIGNAYDKGVDDTKNEFDRFKDRIVGTDKRNFRTDINDPNGDADKDGIPNGWERNGVDVNRDGKIDYNLKKLGADPLHKDIFVEIDFMEFHSPNKSALRDVVNAFAKAPLKNFDGKDGIRLHLFVDEQIPHQNKTTVGGDGRNFVSDFTGEFSKYFGTKSERKNPLTVQAKELIFHHSVFIHELSDGTNSGRGLSPGKYFVISLGADGWGKDPKTKHSVGSRDQQAGTIMHELGHNLDLDHGGVNDHDDIDIQDNLNEKPNYLSVMNYLFIHSDLVPDRPLDYSRCKLDPLNEHHLVDVQGISASCPPGLSTYILSPLPSREESTGTAIDWDHEMTTNTAINLDINNDTDVTMLDGSDDWGGIKFQASLTPMSLYLLQNPTYAPIDEYSFEDVKEHRNMLLLEIEDRINDLALTEQTPMNNAYLNQSMPANPQERFDTLIDNVNRSLTQDDLVAAITNLTLLEKQSEYYLENKTYIKPACTSNNIQHWDRIIFKITNLELAENLGLPQNSELGITIYDDPMKVVDLKQEILTSFGPGTVGSLTENIDIVDIEYATGCEKNNSIGYPIDPGSKQSQIPILSLIDNMIKSLEKQK
ncbi:MAG: hypothetical protein AB7U98_12325 [Candidatus Nitrosocosmicus sp.]